MKVFQKLKENEKLVLTWCLNQVADLDFWRFEALIWSLYAWGSFLQILAELPKNNNMQNLKPSQNSETQLLC